ncbi:MAG: CoA-binding protein [Alphaproteobacteria bacterium]|nr:CoA-binding protein [Alphaproteobacteria bacterium]
MTSPHTCFDALFRPNTIAVFGASTAGRGFANDFIQATLKLGFTGEIYPIHPNATEIEGLKAYPTLDATPSPIDYAFIGIGARHIPAILAAANGRVKFAQVISSGFGEMADGGKALEAELVRAAHAGGMRLLGPNCLGTYSPGGRISYDRGTDGIVGPVGIISQSGGLTRDLLRRGGRRGIRYSAVLSMGNCADLSPSDMLEHFLDDPGTTVIGMYLEHIRDGRRFFEILRAAKARKPVVVLKGGRTQEGSRAAVSHTGALAGDDRMWTALARQTGSILVDTLEQMLDQLLILQHLTPNADKPTHSIALFGNGGGTGVLATDLFARNGLSVPRASDRTFATLKAMELPPGTSLDNPYDTPSGTLKVEDGLVAETLLREIVENESLDAMVVHINMPQFLNPNDRDRDVFGNLVRAAIRVREESVGKTHFVLVLRSDGEPEIEARKFEERNRALEMGVPVFDELPNAAVALAGLRDYEHYLNRRRGGT